ncbi:hypothetical protein EON73_05635, partial [bacterium]
MNSQKGCPKITSQLMLIGQSEEYSKRRMLKEFDQKAPQIIVGSAGALEFWSSQLALAEGVGDSRWTNCKLLVYDDCEHLLLAAPTINKNYGPQNPGAGKVLIQLIANIARKTSKPPQLALISGATPARNDYVQLSGFLRGVYLY